MPAVIEDSKIRIKKSDKKPDSGTECYCKDYKGRFYAASCRGKAKNDIVSFFPFPSLIALAVPTSGFLSDFFILILLSSITSLEKCLSNSILRIF